MRKICSKCGEEKSVSCFGKDNRTKNLLQSACYSCGAKYALNKPDLHKVYSGMKVRCYNKNANRYIRYGGRGIVLCREWLSDRAAFIEWAKSSGYHKGLQIDRIDNNGNYEPNNCRWVTTKENAQDAADYLGVDLSTICRWCNGKLILGKFKEPKEGCWSVLKYGR